MLNFYHIKYSIDYLDQESAMQKLDIKKLRHNIRILIIDDEIFSLEGSLRKAGFNITVKKDIESLTDVEPYQLVLCDIRGVGKAFGSRLEGAYLIKEIKTCYPNIQVIAYTASSYDPTYNTYLSNADQVLTKGVPIDDWVLNLDTQIKMVMDPKFHWKKIQANLIEEGVKTLVIAKIESIYVKGVISKNTKILEGLTTFSDEKASKILSNMLTGYIIKLLVGGFVNAITP
jgi:CheY-like chemotaxis protein